MTDKINDGGPAFPLTVPLEDAVEYHKGMSLRDWFAGNYDPKVEIYDQGGADKLADALGMDRIVLSQAPVVEMIDFGSRAAAILKYRHADAMLKAREAKQ